MLTDCQITEIFCKIDDFCKDFYKTVSDHTLSKHTVIKHKNKHFTMSDSEIMTILIIFHSGCFRNLKHFYIFHIQKNMKSDFPNTVSYNRFTELQQKVILPMGIFLKTCCLGTCSGISFVDSTSIKVCHIKRQHSNKVFKGLAVKGKTSVGWFFGFKLHLVINDKGEILDFVITQGNTDDREPLKSESLQEKLFGKLFGDRGYLSESLTRLLFENGIHLITKVRKNMKNKLMLLSDKILLRKRAIIETVYDELKNICQIEHTRHRCFENFISNLLSGLIAYSFFPKKPSLNIDTI